MPYQGNSPEDYIDQLPEDRQAPIRKLRDRIKKNLPTGFEEGMNYKVTG